MEEIHTVFPIHISKPDFVCKVHEDNQLCIKMDTGIKFSPRTKHISLKYHHFRLHVKFGRVVIHYRPTEEHLADILTKPFSYEAFFTLRYILCGWGYKSGRTWTRQGLSPILGILSGTPVGYFSPNSYGYFAKDFIFFNRRSFFPSLAIIC